MCHGQKIDKNPRALLSQAGFAAVDLEQADLCCGASGGYNLLQPQLAGDMRAIRVATIERAKPDLVASSDIGCILHLTAGMETPVVHVVEVLDWAYGGPVPRGLEALGKLVQDVPDFPQTKTRRMGFLKDTTNALKNKSDSDAERSAAGSKSKSKTPQSV